MSKQQETARLRPRHLWRTASMSVVAVCLSSKPVVGGEPVAIVEQIQAPSTGLQFMDFVEKGRLIRLRAGERLSLGYFSSCIQEDIIGGSVEIGAEQSAVEGGDVTRVRVECDGGHLQLNASEDDASGVHILRSINPDESQSSDQAQTSLPAPELTLYSTAPIVLIDTPAALVRISRLDLPEPPVEFRVNDGYLDLAATDIRLAAGGLYRAEAGGSAVVFQIVPTAASSSGPVIGRLLPL